MNSITIRVFSQHNKIDPVFIQDLETFAEQHGYQIEEENGLFSSNLNSVDSDEDEECDDFDKWKRRLEAFRKKIGPIQSDSTDDIRELRDSR